MAKQAPKGNPPSRDRRASGPEVNQSGNQLEREPDQGMDRDQGDQDQTKDKDQPKDTKRAQS